MAGKYPIGDTTPEGLDTNNSILSQDRCPHDWYRFILSFPPHLVRHYLADFGAKKGDWLIDPFEGTGTTVVEGKKLGLNVIGLEANPVCQFASKVKLNWNVDVGNLERAILLTQKKYKKLNSDPDILPKMPEDQHKLLIKNSISDLILSKCLLLKQIIDKSRSEKGVKEIQLLGVARTAMALSNLKFAPEVSLKNEKKWTHDANVIQVWADIVEQMNLDLIELQNLENTRSGKSILVDSRKNPTEIEENSIDFLFTSPPYPNEKDYTRTTRLESVLLDFFTDRKKLYMLKKGLICSNTRAIHTDDDDGEQIMHLEEITKIAAEIERRRIEQGKTSGFEKLFHKVVLHFFGGMRIHLVEMEKLMKPGGLMGYVVGDQTSFFRVPIPTGKLLALVAEDVGLEIVRIDLFRKRAATKLRTTIREEVVILRKPKA
ncbi:site-specific DNA-methyltransferase [Candidatus Poseidonia alphae]|nr:site-specific DNA-methyltransferase [Candidatus Poseidonia alphae]